MKKLAFLLVLTLAFSMAVLAQDTTQSTGSQTTTTGTQTTTSPSATPSTGSQTSTTGSQTTTTDGQQSTTTTTTTTAPTTAPESTTPTASSTTTQDTSASTLPQRNDEGGAYSHGEFGVQANYLRLATANDLNTLGVGANLDFNLRRHFQLEAQMAYNFERNTTTATTTGGFTSFNRTGLRTLTGLFGPKIISGTGAWRVFGTLQGGFINFNGSNKGPVSGFVGSVGSVTTGDTMGVFYPGVGVEAFAGPIGLRVDVGDEMYFNNGAHNNLRVAAGPQFRF
jgi:hypothetical protein